MVEELEWICVRIRIKGELGKKKNGKKSGVLLFFIFFFAT